MSMTNALNPIPSTRVVLFSRSADIGYIGEALRAACPVLDVVRWPDPACASAEVAIGWDAPPGIYQQLPALKLVHSIAAGVDNLIEGQDLQGVPLCRVVDPRLAEGMVQYVLWGVLHFHRQFDAAIRNQARQVWQRPVQTRAASCRVGLLGMGELGAAVARQLTALGYSVSGWSRTPKHLPGVKGFHAEEGLDAMLPETDILVCLLPLTPATQGILNGRLFDRLPEGACLIQCGRGRQLVESDLRAALESGRLRGALVDVFEREPLDEQSPLWTAPGVWVTPHMATMADTATVVEQVLGNIARLHARQPLLNQVDLARGY